MDTHSNEANLAHRCLSGDLDSATLTSLHLCSVGSCDLPSHLPFPPTPSSCCSSFKQDPIFSI